MSQFDYCPLVWMFHDGGINEKINHIHGVALRMAYQDETSKIQELLIIDDSVSIYLGNLRLLVIEIHRIRMSLNSSFRKEIFVEREANYNLRTKSMHANLRLQHIS